MADLAGLRPGVGLRRHQLDALDGVGEAPAHGGRRAWVVLPPAAGETVVGLEGGAAPGRLIHEVARSTPDVPAIAYATAEALHAAGRIDRGADAVVIAPDETGRGSSAGPAPIPRSPSGTRPRWTRCSARPPTRAT
ncbi:hypothetical protein [Pseudonocardia adelaidensis]|uniref:Beta-ketoacyl synthase N-terminal domain-containing protein n=1 Tax=Pseudonocardia adelaidensis TaxID=648754 RepID=A0ABP9N7W3_9PSEU